MIDQLASNSLRAFGGDELSPSPPLTPFPLPRLLRSTPVAVAPWLLRDADRIFAAAVQHRCRGTHPVSVTEAYRGALNRILSPRLLGDSGSEVIALASNAIYSSLAASQQC